MKFLFAMFQGGGNIPLIVPIAARLVSRGHEVRVQAGPSIRPNRLPVSDGFLRRLADAGVEVAPFQVPDPHPLDNTPAVRGVIGNWLPKSLERIALPARNNAWSSAWAQNVTAEIARGRPDAIAADYYLPGALAAAEAARIPSAALFHNIPPPLAKGVPPRYQGFLPARNPIERLRYLAWDWATERLNRRNGLVPLNRARAELGLAPLRTPAEQFAHAVRVLMLVSEHFDLPARHLPVNVRYVGTPIDDSAAAGTWTSPWPTDDARPLVLVSLSTLSQGQAPALSRIIKSVEGLPIRALVTLGPSLRKEDFDAPPNVVLETFVPHSAVLPHVSAVVTQCGLGTLTKTLVQGLPTVCIPLTGDQPDNAARVEYRGAGIRLSPDAPVGEISDAIRRVIEDPGYRRAAQDLGRKIVEKDGADTAADELEAMARTGT